MVWFGVCWGLQYEGEGVIGEGTRGDCRRGVDVSCVSRVFLACGLIPVVSVGYEIDEERCRGWRADLVGMRILTSQLEACLDHGLFHRRWMHHKPGAFPVGGAPGALAKPQSHFK